MPTVSTTLGAEDRYWGEAEPHAQTPRWMSSGSAFIGGDWLDQDSMLEANGMLTHVDALSTDDTSSYAQLDEVGFNAATLAAGVSSGFLMYLKSSADLALVIPPAADVTSLSFTFEMVARNLSDSGEFLFTANTGTFGTSATTRLSGLTTTPVLGGWRRYYLPVMTLSPILSAERYEHVRQSLSNKLLSVYTWTDALTTMQVAYLAAHITYELVDTSDPYRRIFPRDDSLAGGAGRNYPPSRAVQTGNRTSGGYL